jgi:hypothetical protein
VAPQAGAHAQAAVAVGGEATPAATSAALPPPMVVPAPATAPEAVPPAAATPPAGTPLMAAERLDGRGHAPPADAQPPCEPDDTERQAAEGAGQFLVGPGFFDLSALNNRLAANGYRKFDGVPSAQVTRRALGATRRDRLARRTQTHARC